MGRVGEGEIRRGDTVGSMGVRLTRGRGEMRCHCEESRLSPDDEAISTICDCFSRRTPRVNGWFRPSGIAASAILIRPPRNDRRKVWNLGFRIN